MADLVPAEKIEGIVGVARHDRLHLGRAVSAEQRVYVLHSRACLDSGIDLRECVYSVALDWGILLGDWVDMEDRPVSLEIERGRLVPFAAVSRG